MNLTKRELIFSFLTLIFVCSAGVFAHEAHHESKEEVQESKAPSAESQIELFKAINEDYLKTVKPIFKNSCFSCHSSETKFPWYHSLPFVNDLLDSDVQEAKKHMDLSNNFPFEGHGTPQEDLEAIGKSVREGSMPPFRYRMMHWGSGLSKTEREAILKWVEESQNKLKPN